MIMGGDEAAFEARTARILMYRELAGAAELAAERTADPSIRAVWIKAAANWTALADHVQRKPYSNAREVGSAGPGAAT
ncbi:MAG: hypothetical protein ABSD74_18750 [Rhizomicrobium sp.]|jgi:hypothetical protein